jgi:hypothetical protein
MRNTFCGLIVLISGVSGISAADDWRAKLMPGQRLEVQHGGKIDRGIYTLCNANEIVITTSHNPTLSIPQSEVDRVIRMGTDSPKLSYFSNMKDQLFPNAEVLYERGGAPSAPTRKR